MGVIRRGYEKDADIAIDLIRQSITELCIADHHHDPREISIWLANKTEQAWKIWIGRPDASVLVVEHAGEIIGVGMINHSGEILLNYVSPHARFSGVSKALLKAMEGEARKNNAQHCFVESTVTAQKFYKSCDYKLVSVENLRFEKSLTS